MKGKTFSVVWIHTSVRDATTFSAESRSQWFKFQSFFSHQWTQQVLATSQRDTTQPCQWPVTCGHSWSAFVHHFGETTPSALHPAGVLNRLSHKLQRQLHHFRRRSFRHPLAEVAKLLGVPQMRRFSVVGFHGFGRWGAKVLDMFNVLRTWGLDMFAWVVLRSFAKTYQYGNGSWIKVYIF